MLIKSAENPLTDAQRAALRKHYGLNDDANLEMRRSARATLGTLGGLLLGHKLGNFGVKLRNDSLRSTLRRFVQSNPQVRTNQAAKKKLMDLYVSEGNKAHASKGALTMLGGITGGQLAGRKYSPDDANEIIAIKRKK